MLHPSTKETMQITITAEQIYAAAQKIANNIDNAWQYTEAQILAAVEHYLRVKVLDLLADVEMHAEDDLFSFQRTCDCVYCSEPPAPHSLYCNEHQGLFVADEATELVIPAPPAWFSADVDRATAPMASRPELVPDENGEYLWIP